MSQAIGQHVSDSDAFTLQLEREPGLRATVVAIVELDRAPDHDRLHERLERASRLIPTLREKLVASPLGMATPRWVLDPHFDLSWHVRRVRLAPPGDDAELLDLARHAQMGAFDHDRPLWELTVVEGLDGDRAALVFKVHHALADGIGVLQIAAHVVDLEPDPPALGELPPAPHVGRSLPFSGIADALGHDLRRATELGAGVLRSLPGAAWSFVRDPLGAAAGAADQTASLLRMVRPVTSTRSPVMRGRGTRRHFERVDLPQDELRAAAARHGGTLNDAFLAGVAGGLRLYHQAHTACIANLRVTMPISVRTDDHELGGNHLSLVRFDLPVGITDPGARLEAIHAICAAQRHEPAIEHSEAIAAVMNLLPVAVTAGMLRHVDLLASNVPGFELPVHVAGAEVVAVHAFGATLGSAANLTLVTYRGTCHLGIVTDVDAVPDPAVLRDAMVDGFAEVCRA